MRTMMLFLVLAVQLAPCYGYSPKLQGMMDTCTKAASKYRFGAPDDRIFACASNLGNYFPTTSTLHKCEFGSQDTKCQEFQLNMERRRCVGVCKNEFRDGYGHYMCADNAPGFMMAKYSEIFYPSGPEASLKLRYWECCKKCDHTFREIGSCYGGCLGNLASEYLPTTQASDFLGQRREYDTCYKKCSRDKMGYSTCTGTCLGVVMGKYASFWYGVEDFGDQADCKYNYLGLKNTEGGRSWTPCMMKHRGECFTYRVDGTDNTGHVYWDTKKKAQNYCTDWEQCWGYWEDYEGKFFALDFDAMFDLKKNKNYRYQKSRGAFAKICGPVSDKKYVKRDVANCVGYARIESKKECTEAAQSFGLNGLSKGTNDGTYSAVPDGCSYYKNTEQLFYNYGGDTQCTKTKKSCKNRINLCQGTAEEEVRDASSDQEEVRDASSDQEEFRDASSDEEEVRDASLEKLLRLLQELQ